MTWFSEVQRAAELCVTHILRPRRGRAGAEASPHTFPLTASWLLRQNQGLSTLGKVLEEISAAKEQVLKSIARVFPGNAVLHRDYFLKMPNRLPNFCLIFTKSCLIANLGIIDEK